jgi:hypothetical protein
MYQFLDNLFILISAGVLAAVAVPWPVITNYTFDDEYLLNL